MMFGANPKQLAQLGRTLHEQMSVIAQLMSTIDRTIGSTTWQGPASRRFEQEWNGSFKQTPIVSTKHFGRRVETVLLDLKNYSDS